MKRCASFGAFSIGGLQREKCRRERERPLLRCLEENWSEEES